MLRIGNEMSGISLVFITIIIGLILLVALVLLLYKKRRSLPGFDKEPDYRMFFIMGICFLPMGIVFTTTISPGFIGITGMGLIYMSLGLANRHKWKKNKNIQS